MRRRPPSAPPRSHTMTSSRILVAFALALFLAGAGSAQSVPDKPQIKPTPKKNDGRLPHTKLMPAKLMPDLCVVKYRVSTASPECQAFVDQGLGYYYAYVWMEAARSFETAAKHDPGCAF